MSLQTTANGVTLAWDHFGDKNHPPLLLIQGLGAQMIGWPEKFCRRLADAGFYVIRFDNRDVGMSQRFPAGGYNLQTMADDAAGLLTALNIPAAHIVGQSMGGMIAQHLASGYPQLSLSLTLIYTAAHNQFIIGNEVLAERESQPQARNREEAAALYVQAESPCGSVAWETDTDWLYQLGGEIWDRGYDPQGAVRQRDAIERDVDRRIQAEAIRCPTLILHGDADRLIDYRGSEELHQLIDGSVLEIYPGMGHQLPPPLWDDFIQRIQGIAARALSPVND